MPIAFEFAVFSIFRCLIVQSCISVFVFLSFSGPAFSVPLGVAFSDTMFADFQFCVFFVHFIRPGTYSYFSVHVVLKSCVVVLMGHCYCFYRFYCLAYCASL